MMKLRNLRGIAIAVSLACAGLAAHANTFNCVSGAKLSCAYGENTLSWTWDGSNFTITNDGSFLSGNYVTAVYFDISQGMAVNFVGGTGGYVNFYNTGGTLTGAPADFSSDKGYGSFFGPVGNEGGTATFQITGANTDSFMDGLLAAGVQVRSLITGSTSYITERPTGGGGNNPVSPVPEAETYAMWLLGLGVVGWTARRRKADKAA